MARMPDLPSLLERIAILVDEQPGAAPGRLLEVMEHTLTDGYAHALTLEAEGIRLEREIGTALASMNAGRTAPGLAALAERLEAVERDVRLLRGRLAALRQKAEVVRRASLAA